MATRPDIDDDDDFSEIYKAYTGPFGSSAAKAQENTKTTNKKSQAGSDEEEDERDPNAVPTDFTSREAKVWDAKSKATERNWKKRQEEEMICKICGDSGHFTQGCPSTLGGTRNSQDFFERVAARDKRVRALFSENVIQRIERDIGCKIKMDEKFIIVSGKDRLVLRKGVDAVHKIIKEESSERVSPGFQRERSSGSHRGRSPSSHRGGSPGSHTGRSRSPDRCPLGTRFSRSETQRSNPSPRNASQFHNRFGRQDRGVEDRIRADLQKPSRNSPQAYVNDGGRGRSSHSRSPARGAYSGNSYAVNEAHRHSVESYRSVRWETERRESDFHADGKLERSAFSQTLEDLEEEYKREAIDLARLRDQQEDEENDRHRKVTRELRETHMKRLASIRGSHAKEWEEFLRLDAQRRQEQVHHQQMSATALGGYQPSTFSDYDSLGNQPYAGSNFHIEPTGKYANPPENYPHSRPRDTYNEFQPSRLEGYGRAYNRF